MPKAIVFPQSFENLAGVLHIQVDIHLTDNAGRSLQLPYPIPRQNIPFDGSAVNFGNLCEAKAIGVAAGAGVTIVAADCVIFGAVQGA